MQEREWRISQWDCKRDHAPGFVSTMIRATNERGKDGTPAHNRHRRRKFLGESARFAKTETRRGDLMFSTQVTGQKTRQQTFFGISPISVEYHAGVQPDRPTSEDSGEFSEIVCEWVSEVISRGLLPVSVVLFSRFRRLSSARCRFSCSR